MRRGRRLALSVSSGRCAVADDAAIDLASEAAPGWAAVPLERRLRLGTLFREELLRREDEFVDMLVAESHPVKLARWELSCLLQIYSEESIGWYARQMHTEFEQGDRRLIVRHQPDGVVAFNPPQNAPAPSAALAVLAVMAGNAVVVRAPRSIALSTLWVLRDVAAPLLDEVGAPPGTLNVVCSNPNQTLDRWITSPQIDDIFYIGGSKEGLRFQEQCVAHGKKPILELAGNDGIIVWKDADLNYAAEAITESFYGSGQICMVPNYVLVRPDEEDVLLSPVRRTERFFGLLDRALEQGAELVTGGKRTELDGTPSETGVFLQPTVLRVDGLAAAREHDVVRHEEPDWTPRPPRRPVSGAPECVLVQPPGRWRENRVIGTVIASACAQQQQGQRPDLTVPRGHHVRHQQGAGRSEPRPAHARQLGHALRRPSAADVLRRRQR
ncbi:aldehyde dehydrogenase family protein [Streptomyces bauhiniae]|uniref:aldehyde dehydrogenase family protein n=1 Tax=Streptomyces bauhiniae TaxID=2340725 RepID=UPI001EF24805|nr:aldehyde dehydrogenase [Streptomyces bauhiniae]